MLALLLRRADQHGTCTHCMHGRTWGQGEAAPVVCAVGNHSGVPMDIQQASSEQGVLQRTPRMLG